MRLLLDTMIVSAICTPKAKAHREIGMWFERLVQDADEHWVPLLPEIVDYEVRRGLLKTARDHQKWATRSLRRLDELAQACQYHPIKASIMRRAAELWAEARARGTPTAHPKSLDADVILAAQAEDVGGMVVTENVRHLGRYVEAKSWRDVHSGEM